MRAEAKACCARYAEVNRCSEVPEDIGMEAGALSLSNRARCGIEIENSRELGGKDEGCSWANKGGGGAKVIETEGGAGAGAGARARVGVGVGAGTNAVEDTPAYDTTACDEADIFALKTTKSTLSGRSLLNCFKAFARSHESETVTSNVLVKSIIYSASEGMRLNT